MAGLALGRLVWLAFAAITADVAAMPAQAAPGQDAATLEPSTIETATLETGSSNCISIRLAEDLASVVDGTARRILPVVGPGGVPAIADLLQTPGIDMAIVQLDVLDDARTRRLVPGIENLSYIAKLNYVEFHLLARQEIGSVAELTGKTISVGQPLGNTAITASQLFKLLNLPVTLTNDAPDVAIERLQRGDIGAVALVSGKPSPLLRVLPTQGLHLLSIPLTPGVIGTYVPTRLTVADYPGLVPRHSAVDTVAVGTGLFVGPLAAELRHLSQDRQRRGCVLHPVPNIADAGSPPQMERSEPVQRDSRLASIPSSRGLVEAQCRGCGGAGPAVDFRAFPRSAGEGDRWPADVGGTEGRAVLSVPPMAKKPGCGVAAARDAAARRPVRNDPNPKRRRALKPHSVARAAP